MRRDVIEPCPAGETIPPEMPAGNSTGGRTPCTVGNILDLLKAYPDFAYFCSTFNVFAKYLRGRDDSRDDISLDQVRQRQRRFSVYLANKQFTSTVTARHARNLNTALKRAEDNGWVPDEKMSPAWRKLLREATSHHCDDVLRDFDNDHIPPDEVTVELISGWVDTQVINREHTFIAALRRAGRFSQLLRGFNLLRQPNPNPRYADGYGIPLKSFPSPMKEETAALILSRVDGPDQIANEDLTGTWEDDTRRRQGKKEKQPEKPIRSVSAEMLISSISRICGYVRNELGLKGVVSLQQLFTKDYFEKLLGYLEARNLTSNSIRDVFFPMVTAIRHSDKFDERDFLWLPGFVAALPKPSEAELEQWRARHHIDYSVMEQVPEKIDQDRQVICDRKTTTSGAPMFLSERVAVYSARLFMRSLLVRWELLLPWRAINITNCELGRNLFRKRLDLYSRVRIPAWVLEKYDKNRNAKFWMYLFSPDETKNGYSVAGFLPRPLVDPLNRFVDGGYRGLLAGKQSVNTLFVSDHQSSLSYSDLSAMCAQISLEYAHKRLSFHSYRHSFALEYIQSRRGDYRILSQCLWHHDLFTTLTYLSRFNISWSNAIVDSWYEERLSREGIALVDLPDFTPTYFKDQPPALIFGERPSFASRYAS